MSVPHTLNTQWVEFLKPEFDKAYFKNIINHYKNALRNNECIFPKKELIFNAFNLTLPQDIKVVILGQDPYHNSFIINGEEIPQAMGLSFSVPKILPLPPSLKNIYKELESNLGIRACKSGDLTPWASQGVMLLNSILSVRKNAPASHRYFGWEEFTDNVILNISNEFSGIVFLLWGNFAKKKEILIDKNKHIVITAPHPSPLSRGFLGSNVFTRTQEALLHLGKKEINWKIE